jgi:hypothetical protein
MYFCQQNDGWHRAVSGTMLASPRFVLRRQPLVKGFIAALAMAVAVLTVGLTASAESPFSISVHTAFLRLGVDVDIRLGSFHLHASWSALPDAPAVNQTGGQ